MTKKSSIKKGNHKSVENIIISSLVCSIFIVLMISFVSAVTNTTADVAYIYKSKLKVDQNIVDVFKEMNLTVNLIDERYMPKSFSGYKFIFVGDERFAYNIPVNDYNAIVTNYYFGSDWGLTDNDGVSNLAATFPLSVRKGDQVVQVYTQAKYPNGIAIPYYYLADEDKVPAMQKIAGTYTGTEYDFGDVISYANAGTHLINGKNAKGNICFYGIVASKYWTPEARQMFKECVNFVGTSCSKDIDCPADKIGLKYCKNSSVYQDSTDYFCYLPGTVKSQCNSNVVSNLIEDCVYGCSNGVCLPQCTQNSDCLANQICSNNQCVNITCSSDDDCQDSNAHTSDKCLNPGTNSSSCSHTPITCLNNGECGTDGLVGNFFCQDKNVVINFVTFTCNNPGANSTCSNNTIIKINKTCNDACNNGACVAIACYNDSQCDDSNVKTVDKCLNPGTGQSSCVHMPINCTSNSDCGTNGLVGNLFCQDSNVFNNFITYTCNNPGTSSATCSSATNALLNKTCNYGCLNGNCLPQCNQNSDCAANQICSNNQCVNVICKIDSECDDSNINTIDKCNNPGTVQSYCTNTFVKCNSNSDCGTDGFSGNLFCLSDNSYQNFITYKCNNPRSGQSSCTTTTNPILKQTCTSLCSNGNCIGCFSDEGCGTDKFVGNKYCKGKDIYQDFEEFSCTNAGQSNSQCLSNTLPKLVQSCADSCYNGECKNIKCTNANDCDDSNTYTIDECNNAGTTSSYCSNTPVNCLSNNDCGITGFGGQEFCIGADVFKNYQESNCRNPGTRLSYCDISIEQKFIVDCGTGKTCSSGICMPVKCNSNAECGTNGYLNQLFCQDNNVFDKYIIYTCNNPGTSISSCSNNILDKSIKTCQYGCENGNCLSQCNQNSDCQQGQACLNNQCISVVCSSDDDCEDSDAHTVDTCLNPGTIQSSCSHTPINCNSNAECGTNAFVGNNFCQNSNVFQNFITYTCNNPGTASSSCSSSTNALLKQTCLENQICNSGSCINQQINCSNNNECSDNNLYTADLCNNPGTVQSYCSHTGVNCVANNDCGLTGFTGSEFCSSQNKVSKNFMNSTCINGGTVLSHCELSIIPKVVNDCGAGICENGVCFTNITCNSNSDCGTNGNLNQLMCKNNSVFDKFVTYTCNSPGTSSASCSSSISDVLKQTCAANQVCSNGECVNLNIPCSTDSQCNDANTHTFDKCNNPGTPQSFCSHIPIVCLNNAECGTDEVVGNLFCQDSNVFQNFLTFTCNNPGTIQSSCDSLIAPQLKQTCSAGQTCNNGECQNVACSQNSDCGTNGFLNQLFCKNNNSFDKFKTYTCNNPGTALSSCSNALTDVLKQTCSFGCSNGICNNNQCVDVDNDNYDTCNPGTPGDDGKPVDCNDNNANIHPNAVEICNLIDDDCDGQIDEGGVCACSQNSDCGTNHFLNQLFCKDGNVFDKFKTYTCNSPGTSSASCSNVITDVLKQTCSANQICSNGECVNLNIPCSTDAQCNDANTHTFDKCNNPGTPQSFCSHTPIVCLNNAECGTDAFVGNLFCQSSNVFQNFISFTCNNPGTINSSCDSLIAPQLKQICAAGQTCNNGQCQNVACSQNSDCGTNGFLNQLFCKNNNSFDKYKTYTCNNPGTSSASCSNALTDVLKQTCSFGCSNGICNNNQCVDVDNDNYDTCNPGTPGDDGNPVDCNDNNPNVHPNAVEICNLIDDDCDGLIDEGGVCACYQNSDCGIDHFLNQPFCKNGSIYDKYKTYNCNSPGTPSASCSNAITDVLKQTCAENQICSTGTGFNPDNGETFTVGNSFEEVYNFVKSKDSSLGTCSLSGKGNAMKLAAVPWSTGSCSQLSKSQLDQTATKICNLAGYRDPNTWDSFYNLDGGRCNWFTPADDCTWYWTGSNWQYSNSNHGANKFGERWITKLSCINKLPGPGDTGTTAPTCTNIVCSTDADCNDNNAGTTDKCINPGTVQSSCTHTACPVGGQNSNYPSPAQCTDANWNIGVPNGVTCSGSATIAENLFQTKTGCLYTQDLLSPNVASLNKLCQDFYGSNSYAKQATIHSCCHGTCGSVLWQPSSNSWLCNRINPGEDSVGKTLVCATGCNTVC